MKKLIVLIGCILLIIGFIATARAEEATEPGKTKQLNRQTRIEEMQQKREEFKIKLQQVQDKRKQKIAERINLQLAHINERATTHMTKVLNRLSALMDKLSTRLATMKAEGKETGAAEAAVVKAKEAIATAQTAVSVQAGKEYLIEFTDESGLKVGASAAKTGLKNDLKAVKILVKTAKDATKAAIDAAKLIK